MPHYYSKKQQGKFTPFPVKIKLKKIQFELYSAPGVFSKKELDKGTKLLIENCVVKDGECILDIGCGYGAIGISLAKIVDINVLMTDINERAVFLAKKNIKEHKLDKVKAKKSDLYDKIDEKFDSILTNPPQTAGKKVCFEIIEGAKEHLKKGGTFQLVARHQKGGKELEKKMNKVFKNVEQVAKGSGFRVYISKN
ncbi:class I SAM-dependent methyltransferase [Candidatus Woesearchaeota archaeon]|nr:class I SAM-dependent methyltransferase [Candidatus Woesearchaeota archaeon]